MSQSKFFLLVWLKLKESLRRLVWWLSQVNWLLHGNFLIHPNQMGHESLLRHCRYHDDTAQQVHPGNNNLWKVRWRIKTFWKMQIFVIWTYLPYHSIHQSSPIHSTNQLTSHKNGLIVATDGQGEKTSLSKITKGNNFKMVRFYSYPLKGYNTTKTFVCIVRS